MAKTRTKGAAIVVAMGLISWGLQQFTVGARLTGGVAVLIGVAIGGGYQFLEDGDHRRAYNEVVDAIGEENLREIADMTADELRQLKEQVRSGE